MEDIYGIQEENWKNFHNRVAYRKKIPLSTFKFKIPRELELLKRMPRSVVPRRYLATPDTMVELSGNIVNQIPLPEVFKWTSVDVMKWLDKMGFPQYRDTFYHNFINGRTLLLVDASALQAMNIKKFAHIKIITDAIRKLYEVELVLFNRSISLPPRYPGTHYKLYRVHTGPKYLRTRPTDLWRKMKILRDPPTYENHWTTLEKWLKHIPDYQLERIGYAPRRNLYKVKKAPLEVKIEEHKPPCNCIPPCECKWTKKHLRLPWSLEYLKNLVPIEEEDLCACVISSKETIEGECLCPEEIIEEEEMSKTDGEQYFETCNCIPPCECDWIDRQYKSQWMLTILKVKLNRKYSIETAEKLISLDK